MPRAALAALALGVAWSTPAAAQDGASPDEAPAGETPPGDAAPEAPDAVAEPPEDDPRDDEMDALRAALDATSKRLETLEAEADQRRKAAALDAGGLQLTFGGMIQYDFRFRPQTYEDNQYGDYYNEVPNPLLISRNELITRFNVGARLGKFGAKTSLDFVLRAYPQVSTVQDLSQYNAVTPFRFEAHEAYLYGSDLFPGFDIAIGQQKIMFGVGDQFNPTNTVNPLDLEDVLLFGDRIGNLMVRLDYRPVWNWQLTGVLIPIFKPALLPRTGYLAQRPSLYPFNDEQTRWAFGVERAIADGTYTRAMLGEVAVPLGIDAVYPTIVRDVNIMTPAPDPANMQGFFRVAGTFGSQDLALSYYRGFNDIPMPTRTETFQVTDQRCEIPEDVGKPVEERSGQCVDGVLANDTTLSYPRMHVLGLNWAGEATIGYRLELGVFFPEEPVGLFVNQNNVVFDSAFATVTQNGPYPFRTPTANQVLDTRPFAKWTLGIDYTFNENVYLNVQWVHGFPDEFGAGDWIQPGDAVRGSSVVPGSQVNGGADCITAVVDFLSQPPVLDRTIDGSKCAREWIKPKLGDYLVLGLDFSFAAQRGLFRLFTIWDLIGVFREEYDFDTQQRTRTHYNMFTEQGFSAVIYPDFRWRFGSGFELHAGALLNFGQRYSKFGAPEAGGHQVWTRARYSF